MAGQSRGNYESEPDARHNRVDFLVLTVIEQGGRADLSHRAFQLEAEGVATVGFYKGCVFSVVLKGHSVEV